MCVGGKFLWLKEEATIIKPHKNILLLRNWWKKCWLRDCTKLQNPEEQSPARTWRHDFASPLSQGKICCSLPVLQNCARWWKQRIDVFLEGKKKETVHTYFTDPFLLVSPLCLLDWMVMKDVYWWMTTAPAEWHPESHALLKNVSSACVFAFLSHVTDWAPRRTCHAWSRALHEMTRDSKKA